MTQKRANVSKRGRLRKPWRKGCAEGVFANRSQKWGESSVSFSSQLCPKCCQIVFFFLLFVYRHQPFAMLQGSVLLTQTVRQRPGPCWKDGIPSGLRATTVVALRSGSLAGGAAEDEGEGGIQPEGQLGRRQTPLWKYWPKCSSETHTRTRSKIKNAANRQSSACKGLPILHSCRLACSPQKRALH